MFDILQLDATVIIQNTSQLTFINITLVMELKLLCNIMISLDVPAMWSTFHLVLRKTNFYKYRY